MQLIIPDSRAPNALGMLEDAMKTITSGGGKTPSSLANLFLDKRDVYKRRAGSEVGLKMPKFKISTSLDAATIFTDMGIDKPFGGT